MNFITIQNQLGETVAINPRKITSVCYGLNNKTVLIYLGSQLVHTKFTDLRSAIDYINQAYTDIVMASGQKEVIDDLWKSWGDI